MEIAYSNGSLWELFPGETACRSLTLYQRQGGVEREECVGQPFIPWLATTS